MITLTQLSIGYQGHAVIDALNGTFEAGSLTAVIGANGTGKSTLLKTIAGLLPAVGGTLSFAAGRKPRVAYLPQQAELDHQFPLKVFEVVAMGCWPATGLLRRLDKPARARINGALDRVGLESMAARSIETLSGGQFQRMLFARLLVQQAPLILLDEPFAGIDIPTGALLMDVIDQLHKSGHTILVVLHDDALVIRRFPQTLLLSRRRARWGATAAVLEEREGRQPAWPEYLSLAQASS
ncbi:metal ABC transporter ATP-binding protein [Acerihabitans arboris]|uniref:ATP-binding cassette domain-containing protein n=1 Tax=Acerihabitans arboris TaxID=2691583 RepID=A0A845SQ30_9GAMM|nr:ABC transporter ATP-binding protein [Acerihabitans arboris]NDL65026.1 ATP-binding cassette domain-containing protein [Acerihabitans arboris]